MALTRVLFTCISLLLLLTSGCYHMRVNPEPLPTRHFSTIKSKEATLRTIKRVLEDEMQLRILDEYSQGAVLISAPHYVATETGFGQPAGGRRYYFQLHIEVNNENDRRIVFLSPYHFEIRTSYAYGLEGQVKTLYKIYPYAEYPGMFELSFLEQELQRIGSLLENALKDIQ